MGNADLVKLFELIADLMEIDGAVGVRAAQEWGTRAIQTR
jgi:hypothetical protein